MYERFPEYTAKIRRALKETPGGKLSGDDLRRAAGFQVGILLPVVTQMEQEGTLKSEWDYSTYPARRLYSLTTPPQESDK